MHNTTEQDSLKENVSKVLQVTIDNISQKSKEMKRSSTFLQAAHSIFTFLMIVGGVTAPALVEYSGDCEHLFWAIVNTHSG